jgi:hypothetical protein
VALKVAPVDGAGSVVSRTRYVGREFRGRNGSPDEGRFGNYFSHIVVGGDDDPFDGLLGIELWDAPHWTDVESPEPWLAELGPLEPGPLDADRVASILSSAPRRVLAAVLDAAVAALDGGPRVVLVDADVSRAAAWIGWICFALPAAQAQRLTFTTFDGRPRYADDVHVCITTPACDTAFAAHELGHSVRLIDVGGAVPSARPSLYARVALALSERGAEVLAGAVRAVPATATGARRGTWLAVNGAATALVEGDEVADAVDLLRELAQDGRVALAAETARELFADTATDRATLAQWAALHRVARARPPDEDSRSLAATVLARVVPFAGELPDEIAAVGSDMPTQPGVGNLAPWLSAVEATAGTSASGPLIRDGLKLGLIGVNAAVDRRLARALSAGLAHTSVRATMRTIGARRELEHVIVAITEALADRAADDRQARDQLREIARHPSVRATLRRRAEEQRTFDRVALWRHADVASDPSQRRSAASELASLATSERDAAEIRALWSPSGPSTEAEHVELLAAYLNGGVEPPPIDVDRALAELMRHPLTKARTTDPLGATLGRCGQRVNRHPSYRAWMVATTKPGPSFRFATWAVYAGVAMAADEVDLPEPRWQELWQYVCMEVLRQRRAQDYGPGITALRTRAREEFDDGLVLMLEESLRDDLVRVRLIAELYEIWRRLPRDGADLVGDVLMRATESVKRRDLEEVAEYLPAPLHADWAAWQESRPRSTVARAFGRRGRRKDELVDG